MSKKHRQSTLDALNKFYENQLPKTEPVKSRAPNKSPEKDVEKECLIWMRSQGWTVNIYEAKAKWNSGAERFTSTGMRFGTSDCMGNDDKGFAIAVEFKARGRLASFNSEQRYLQRKFIIDRINTNAFACVVDSVERLEEIYNKWISLRGDLDAAKAYLLAMLPQASEKTRLKRERLFDD